MEGNPSWAACMEEPLRDANWTRTANDYELVRSVFLGVMWLTMKVDGQVWQAKGGTRGGGMGERRRHDPVVAVAAVAAVAAVVVIEGQIAYLVDFGYSKYAAVVEKQVEQPVAHGSTPASLPWPDWRDGH